MVSAILFALVGARVPSACEYDVHQTHSRLGVSMCVEISGPRQEKIAGIVRVITGAKVHISVTGGNGTVDGRTRAYLESRLFNTLRSVDRDIGRIDVSLSYGSVDVSRAVTCTIVVDLGGGEQIVATAVADWPYASIDGAVRKAWRSISATATARRRC